MIEDLALSNTSTAKMCTWWLTIICWHLLVQLTVSKHVNMDCATQLEKEWEKIMPVENSDDGLYKVFMKTDYRDIKCSHFLKEKEQNPGAYIQRNGCIYKRAYKMFYGGTTAYRENDFPKEEVNKGKIAFEYPELICNIRFKELPEGWLEEDKCVPIWKQIRVTLIVNGCNSPEAGRYGSYNETKTIMWPLAENSLL